MISKDTIVKSKLALWDVQSLYKFESGMYTVWEIKSQLWNIKSYCELKKTKVWEIKLQLQDIKQHCKI